MNIFSDYLANYIIGLTALLIWGAGAKMGLPADLIGFATSVLPIVVGHAVGKSQRNVTPSGIVAKTGDTP